MRQERKRSGEMGRGKGEEDGFRGGEGRHGGWGVDSKRGRRFGGKVLKTFGVGRFVCGGKEEACAGWLREEGTAGGCRRGSGWTRRRLMFPGAMATCGGFFF